MDAVADTGENEGAYRGSSSVHSEASYIGGISDTESGEDEDLALQGHSSAGIRNKKQGESTTVAASLDATGRVAWPQALTTSEACRWDREVNGERRSSLNRQGS